MSEAKSEHYKAAGVDIDAGDSLVKRIAPIAEGTRIPGASEGLGGFGGMFDLAAAGFGEGTRLVSGTDGVGTKLRVAFSTGVHDTIGVDCVAMCVNDILTTGARPLFFLDYFATGRLDPEVGAAVVKGVADGCKQSGCWLMGGETAEMPGMYPDGEYDLAGFAVGALAEEQEFRADACDCGDVVIALPSSGIHSNGFSLVRAVFSPEAGWDWNAPLDGDDKTLAERMLVPTRIYAQAVRSLQESGVQVRAASHITGGGLWENPQRSIPKSLGVAFDMDVLRELVQPIFRAISHHGDVPEREMYRVFNMGVGFLFVVGEEDVAAATQALEEAGESPSVVGRLVSSKATGPTRVTLDGISDAPVALG